MKLIFLILTLLYLNGCAEPNLVATSSSTTVTYKIGGILFPGEASYTHTTNKALPTPVPEIKK